MLWLFTLFLPLATNASVTILHTNLHSGITATAQVQYFSLVSMDESHGIISVVITHDNGDTTTVDLAANVLYQFQPVAISSNATNYDNAWQSVFGFASLSSPTFTPVAAATQISLAVDGSVTQTVYLSELTSLPSEDHYYAYDPMIAVWSTQENAGSAPTPTIAATNLNTASASFEDVQFIRILNNDNNVLDSGDFSIDVYDINNQYLGTIYFPSTSWPGGGY